MERMIRGGVARHSQVIEQDLRVGDTRLQRPHIKGLKDCRTVRRLFYIAVRLVHRRLRLFCRRCVAG